jgi:hypothetical protein
MANTIQISADTSGFVSGVQRAENAMRGLGRNIQQATSSGMFSGLADGFGQLVGGISIMASLAAAARSFYSAMEAGGALVDLSGQTGVAVDKLMVLQTAFDQAGMSAGDVQPVIAKLQKSIAEAATGNDQAIAKFRAMGVAVKDIQGLSADEQLAAVGEAISKIENPAQRSAMAMEIFGKSGAKLLSVFSAGGLEDVQTGIGNQAQLMVENAGIFDRATDVLGMAGTKIQGFFVGMASQIMPPLMGAVEAINGIDLSGIGEAFGSAIASAIVLFQNFDTVGSIILNSLTLAFTTVTNFFWEQMTTSIFKVGDVLSSAFSAAVSFFKNDFTTISSTVYEKIKSALQSAVGFFANAWSDLGPKVLVPLKIAFGIAVNFFNEAFQKTIPSVYASLKIAFANAINYLSKEVSVVFAKVAAAFKAMLPGGGNMQEEVNKAQAKERAKPDLIDVGKLESEKAAIEAKPIKPVVDITQLQKDFEALNYKTVKPLFNTENFKANTQKDIDNLRALKEKALADARKNNPPPAPAPTGAEFLPKGTEKAVGGIVSSMAKIGGDIGGPQTNALDIQRQQLQAQQRTADNTAKLVAQMSKPTGGATSIVYQ